MNRILSKIFRREVGRSPGRFIAIFLIIVLGAGFFAGLQSAAPSMEATADSYFDSSRLADFRLLCTMGVTGDDVAALAALPEISEAVPGYRADVMASIGEQAVTDIYAVHSLPEGTTGAGVTDGTIAVGLSRPTLTKGRLPAAPDECLTDAKSDIKIGDAIVLSKENEKSTLDLLTGHSLTVVGLIRSPDYISPDKGRTSSGDTVQNYLYVLPSAFDSDYYTEISLRLNETDKLSAFGSDYEALVEKETATLETFLESRAKNRYDELLKEAEEKIADAEAEYAKKKKTTKSKLADAKAELKDGSADLKKEERTYEQKTADLNSAKARLKKAKSELAGARKTLDKNKKELTKQKKELAKGKSGLATMKSRLKSLRDALAAATDPVTAATLKAQIKALNSQIASLSKQVEKGKKAVAAAEKKIKKGEAAYTKGKNEIALAERRIQASEAALKKARSQLASARKDLNSGQSKYETKSEKADSEFSKAQAKIDKAKKELEELETPEWFILSRDDFPGYSGFSSNADRIRNLSLIVPWFFFLIAALVCLTTMTRMVEEHRTRIGVLKALGYRRRSIMGRYQFYAWFIGILGGIIGVVAGLYFFPEVIWNIYATAYYMGDFVLAISLIPCIIGMLGGTVAISIATAAACRSALSSNAAALMRPKAPKPGKRVLLERIHFIWHLLSFSQKVTVRNLFRYKNRFIMTIIGIAGCTALIVSGFGMRDSIGSMVDIQYGEVTPSRADIYLDRPSGASANTSLNKLLAQADCVSDYVHYDEADISAGARNNNDIIAYLTVPEDPADTDSFAKFSERVSHNPIAFPPDESAGPAVILTEQLAKALDVSAGDRIDLGIKDGAKKEVQVAGVTENYISNYIYLTPASYETLFGSAPEYSAVLLNTDMPEESLDRLLTRVGADENVISTLSITPAREIVDQIVENLAGVVNLIILVAAMLAFIVLYNLTNINITERERELATLKVLGFYPREVAAYISRETMILTVIGMGVGLVGGIFLHDYVMGSIELDNFMFPRIIRLQSYGYAAAFTIICSFIIGFCMRPRLKRIDPVGSLKSVE